MCAPHSVSVKVWQVSLSLLISFADGETNCSWLSVLPRCINSQSSARRADIFFFFNWCLLFTRTVTSSKRRDCTLSEKSKEQKVISLFKLSHKVHTNYTGRSYALSYRIGRNYYVTWHVTLLTYISFLMYIFSVKLIGMNIVRTYPVPYMMCWKHRSGSQKQFLLIIYR